METKTLDELERGDVVSISHAPCLGLMVIVSYAGRKLPMYLCDKGPSYADKNFPYIARPESDEEFIVHGKIGAIFEQLEELLMEQYGLSRTE